MAIMQPTFLPWLGYFALMEQADVFVFLDDVQFSKQSWQCRNRIKGPNGEIMLSLPVARKPSKPLIKDALLAPNGFERKLMKSVAACLGKAPHYPLVEEILTAGLARTPEGLSAVNRHIITAIARATGLDTRIVLASESGVSGGEKAERLLAFCESYGARQYLSPVGSYDYLSAHDPFAQSPVALRFQNFAHPEYPQFFGSFQSHLAAIDALAHVGPDGFLPLVRAGIHPPHSIEDIARMSQ
ncbi:WbqC-like protein family protein [Pseudoruegeria aquimaris]|uniref:WbqC-like protein family protein n=1 Tax=Pseudoruegeria aquimaris TaxID=393663 RepID=A0A1Y5TCY8_9RHOB|nr:WbqC family protein [Pseudoruegeria aquimaris]SLN57619.1 WbqC-like protein family protein [Pseudoruegeria aquimaris]